MSEHDQELIMFNMNTRNTSISAVEVMKIKFYHEGHEVNEGALAF